jgi:arginine-tRNA-protein transferase
MQSLFRFTANPSPCGYLPEQFWSLEYEYVAQLSAAEYLQRMLEGWRRFGMMLFRPACRSCTACHSLRVSAAKFCTDRSQRRCRQANEGIIELRIGQPSVTRAKLALYDRYHTFQSQHKGWPEHGPRDPESYADAFVVQPFAVEEWCYFLGERLVGVGYVDVLPGSAEQAAEAGLSAIYFFYDPAERDRSLGTWNVLSMIDAAAGRGLPYVYLGYYVAGCASMEYKRRFRPNQVRHPDGVWRELDPVAGAR